VNKDRSQGYVFIEVATEGRGASDRETPAAKSLLKKGLLREADI
jgi:hypothetical protein